jgi:hypothetical protein
LLSNSFFGALKDRWQVKNDLVFSPLFIACLVKITMEEKESQKRSEFRV